MEEDSKPGPVETFYFSVVVVRNKEGKYLAVKESRNRGWWLPAGRVENGETMDAAAHRETLEEAGIKINLEGILRVEHTFQKTYARMRVVYFATPVDDTPPKSIPDKESEEARWVTLDELRELAKKPPGFPFKKKKKLIAGLRGDELVVWVKYLEQGGQIYPLSIFARETALPQIVKK